MESLNSVYVANIFGIILLCTLLLSHWRRLQENNTDSKNLFLMMFFAFMGCVIDPITFAADSQQGALNRFIMVAGNSLLFLSHMFSAFFWFKFLQGHLKIRISAVHRYILKGTLAIGIIALAVNAFYPFVFCIDENNAYTRQAGFYLYVVINYGLILDSIFIYLLCRHKSGTLKSFPVWIYIAPVLAATVVQIFNYGFSLISSSFSIAIAGIIASLQSERIYTDKVTLCHNFAYLELLEKKHAKSNKSNVSAIMINLNDFKKTNLLFGRSAADKILRKAADLISQSIGDSGTVVRYTSDEFLAFINTQDEMAQNMFIASILSGFDEFNRDSKNGQNLSACFCSCNWEKNESMNDFIEKISKLMHEEKMEYKSQKELREG